MQEHPTSRAPARGSRSFSMPRVIVRFRSSEEAEHCWKCGCRLWSGNADETGLCAPCHLKIGDLGLDAEHISTYEFRFAVLIFLVQAFLLQSDVNLLEQCNTTDQDRVYRAVQYWRSLGFRIVAGSDGRYKILKFDARPRGRR